MGKKSRWPRTILRRNHWKVGVPTYSPLALRPRPSTPPTSTSLSTYLMPSSSSSSSAPSFFGSFCGSNVRSALETGGSSSFLLGGALWLDAPAPLPGLVCLAAEGAAGFGFSSCGSLHEAIMFGPSNADVGGADDTLARAGGRSSFSSCWWTLKLSKFEMH